MARELSPKQSRGVALGLLVLAVLLAYFVLVHWWFTAPQLDIADEMDTLKEQEQRFRATSAQRTEIEQRLKQVRLTEASNPAFLPETDFDAAAAGLIQRLSQVVTSKTDPQNANRCQLIQKQYTRSTEKEPFERVTIKARLRCDWETLAPILHELESTSPVLFIDEVQAWKQSGYRAPGANAVESFLDVHFDVYGYIHRAATKPEAPVRKTPMEGGA